MKRREFTGTILASMAASLLPRIARATPPRSKRAHGGIRKLAVIYMPGGMDSLFSIDPKETAQVDPRIGPTFSEKELLTRGNIRLAPAYHELAHYLDRMQIVHGLQCRTVAHLTGDRQVQQMRTQIVSTREASFLTRAGEALDPNAVLHSYSLSGSEIAAAGRSVVDAGGDELGLLLNLANDDSKFDMARSALRAELKTAGTDAQRALEIVDFLLTRLRGKEMPAPMPQSARIPVDEWPQLSRQDNVKPDGSEFALAHFVLANDLAPTVSIDPFPTVWDTHGNNDALQAPLNHQLARWLRHFLDQLAATPRPGGKTLLDETGVIVLSEMSRFPFHNQYGGKDHFPQISVALFGPGLVNGAFGETDKELVATPLHTATGKKGAGARLLTLDDLGRTLLEWVGHNAPEKLGYSGSVLEFCFA